MNKIKMNLKATKRDGARRMDVAEDCVPWRVLAVAVASLLVPAPLPLSYLRTARLIGTCMLSPDEIC